MWGEGGGVYFVRPPISFLMVRPLIKIVFKPLWRKSVHNCVDKCTSDFHEVQF